MSNALFFLLGLVKLDVFLVFLTAAERPSLSATLLARGTRWDGY